MRIGSTRIVRVDAHNVAVERLDEFETRQKVDGKLTRTGEIKTEWREIGYYGHRIDLAAESALFLAMPTGEITPKLIRDAIKEIAANTATVLEVGK